MGHEESIFKDVEDLNIINQLDLKHSTQQAYMEDLLR